MANGSTDETKSAPDGSTITLKGLVSQSHTLPATPLKAEVPKRDTSLDPPKKMQKGKAQKTHKTTGKPPVKGGAKGSGHRPKGPVQKDTKDKPKDTQPTPVPAKANKKDDRPVWKINLRPRNDVENTENCHTYANRESKVLGRPVVHFGRFLNKDASLHSAIYLGNDVYQWVNGTPGSWGADDTTPFVCQSNRAYLEKFFGWYN